jgi:ABC-type transport system substrate-binding protein
MCNKLFCNILFVVLFSAILIIPACKCNKDNGYGKTANNDDSLSFIKISDADTFYSDWSKENTLVTHSFSEPDMLHPTNGVSADRMMIFSLIHRFVIATDIRNLSVRADLVKSLPEISKDELTYTYELKAGIKWDDGSALTADDIIFTLKANKCPLTDNPSFRVFLANVKDVVKVSGSASEFQIIMKKPYINNISFLTDFPIIERKLFDKDNVLSNYSFSQFDEESFSKQKHSDLDEWATEFNSSGNGRDPGKISGLGPYKVESWESRQSLVLVKKKNISKSAVDTTMFANAFPDKIIFKINTDQNSLALEFKSQTYDLSNFFTTKTLLELQKNKDFNRNYNSAFIPNFNYSYMALNIRPDGIKHKDFFTDKKVRKACAYLTPVEEIITMMDKGKSKRMISPVSPLKKDFNASLIPIPLNINRAKELLDSAGWKDTDGDKIRDKMINGEKVQFEFTLKYANAVPDWKDIALLIQESFYKAGLKVILTPLDFSVIIDDAQSHNFDALLGVWGGSSAPEDFTQLWHTSSWISNGSNYTGFGNSVSDALIDSIKYMVDDAKRAPLVKRFQKMVYDDQPYVFLKTSMLKIAVHKRFGNADMYYERPGLLLNNLKLLYNTNGVVMLNLSAP